jgi:hypothetical protein
VRTVETEPHRGSRAQCLGLTESVADRLHKIVKPHATIEADRADYFPKGPDRSDEAKLGETEGLLSAKDREAVTAWWLADRPGANTPNWDIASPCLVGSRPGLILVEAKAHYGELGSGGGAAKNPQNQVSIRDAIAEANQTLNRISSGWNLTADSHYQLCNRFAWGWKIASLGVPVILVYLGFLNVEDMPGSRVFRTDQEWQSAVLAHAEGVVPSAAWEQTLDVNGTPLVPLIRSWPAA